MADEAMLAEEPKLFERLERQPPDALLALIGMARADSRPGKMDLGVGVYRDAKGDTPILRAVKAAEAIKLKRQQTKSYLGSAGDRRFAELVRELLFGPELASDERIVGVQTPGGCGALRLGAELVRAAGGERRIHIGLPSWPNHVPLLSAAGLPIVEYEYYDLAARRVRFGRMTEALERAPAGDIVLLQGSCHNPTGADLDAEQWDEVTAIIAERGLVPFIDIAYQGLGRGLDEDAAGTRLALQRCDQALVAQSCDKNFGLYRERTGSLWVKAPTAELAETAYGNLLGLARTNWSMPPDHGAALVRIILEDAPLAADWREELGAMLGRIRSLRARLAEADPRLAYLDAQNGMFSMLPLSREDVARLRERHGIYMAASGRFNVVGLSDEDVPRFAAAVGEFLPGGADG
ncbi:MAG: amino acid aminotransferase [Sphingomonadaceae bacterium]